MLHLIHLPHFTTHKHETGKIFAWISLFMQFAQGAFWVILPLILNELLEGDKTSIGYYFSIFAVVNLIGSLLTSFLFNTFDKIKVFTYGLIIVGVSLILMSVAFSIYSIAALDVLRSIFVMVVFAGVSLFIADFSADDKKLSKNYTFSTLFSNIGYASGGIFIGYIGQYFGISSGFVLIGIVYLLTLVYFKHQHLIMENPHITSEVNEHHQIPLKTFFTNIRDYFRYKELARLFVIVFSISAISVFHRLYGIILLADFGFSVIEIGIIKGIPIALSFLAVTYLSKIVSLKDIKKVYILFFVALSILCLSYYFLFLGSYKWPLYVFFPLAELGFITLSHCDRLYFFKSSPRREKDKLYGIYSCGFILGKILIPLFVSLILLFGLSLNFFWIILVILQGAVLFLVKGMPERETIFKEKL